MTIEILRNKAAKDITQSDFESVTEALMSVNQSLKIHGYEDIDGVLHVNFDICVEHGGQVSEQLRFGKFVSLVETGVSSQVRAKMMADEKKEREKKREIERKKKITRNANKPEESIRIDGELASFKAMMAYLIKENNGRDYDSRFMKSIANKKRLTNRQHNYLCKVAGKFGYLMTEKKVTARKKSEPSSCSHEDLGSLGYKHGDVVDCPYCGRKAEVW